MRRCRTVANLVNGLDGIAVGSEKAMDRQGSVRNRISSIWKRKRENHADIRKI